MYHKIRNFLRGVESKEIKDNRPHQKPKEKTDEKVQLSRRQMLKGIGALGIAVAAGINTAACNEGYDYRERFSQNFNIYDYPQFKPDEQKEWQEQKGYVDKDIGLCLQETIDEEIAIKLPVDKLFTYNFQNGRVNFNPVSVDKTEIKKILQDSGIKADKVEVTLSEYAYDLTISQISPAAATVHFRLYTGLAIFINGTPKFGPTTSGREKSINFNFNNGGTGVAVFSGPSREVNGKTVTVGDKVKIISPDGNKGTFSAEEISSYEILQKIIINISNPESLIAFLKSCTSTHMAEMMMICYFDSHRFKDLFPEVNFIKGDFSNVNMDQLLEIFRLLPRDPHVFAGFMRFTIGYSKSDQSMDDEFRHPINTLRSGWGDCDDYTEISYFWAYLNRYKPYLVGIKNGDDRHVFIWYQDEHGLVNIINNSSCVIMQKGQTLNDYLAQDYRGWELEFNDNV